MTTTAGVKDKKNRQVRPRGKRGQGRPAFGVHLDPWRRFPRPESNRVGSEAPRFL